MLCSKYYHSLTVRVEVPSASAWSMYTRPPRRALAAFSGAAQASMATSTTRLSSLTISTERRPSMMPANALSAPTPPNNVHFKCRQLCLRCVLSCNCNMHERDEHITIMAECMSGMRMPPDKWTVPHVQHHEDWVGFSSTLDPACRHWVAESIC